MRNRLDMRPTRGQTSTGPLLCISGLIPRNGIDTLLTAFGMLADDRPALDLELIGDGPLEAALRRQARELALDERIHFRGALPLADVRAALHRCAMLVLPCWIDERAAWEGLGTVLLEAMDSGTAVVTTDILGLPELARRDVTGLLVAPDDPAGLAVAIATLLEHPARAAHLGAAGRRPGGRVDESDERVAPLQLVWRQVHR